jgi:hypothetical protein
VHIARRSGTVQLLFQIQEPLSSPIISKIQFHPNSVQKFKVTVLCKSLLAVIIPNSLRAHLATGRHGYQYACLNIGSTPCKYNVKKMVETAFGLGILTLYQIEPHTSLPHPTSKSQRRNREHLHRKATSDTAQKSQNKERMGLHLLMNCKDHQILKTLSLMPKTSGFNSG